MSWIKCEAGLVNLAYAYRVNATSFGAKDGLMRVNAHFDGVDQPLCLREAPTQECGRYMEAVASSLAADYPRAAGPAGEARKEPEKG